MGKNDPEFWTVDDTEDVLTACSIEEALEQWADKLHPAPLPETVVVYGFARMELPSAERLGEDALESALEWLDQDFGNPDEGTTPNDAMKAAALAFGEAIRANYTAWGCERVTQEEVQTREYLPAEWFSPTPEAP